MFNQLPPDKREPVRRALSGFGPIEALEAIAGGLSGSGVWRVRARGGAVILKIERPADGLNDYARQYACMALAAEAGVSPRLLFADTDTGIAVIEHIEPRPLPRREALLPRAASLLGRLHLAPVFPPLIDFPEGVAQLIGRLQGLDLVDRTALEPVLALWAELRPTCRWGEDGLVASHNDPNPGNLVWDGERLWLIDWEAAFRNDPFVDLAIVSNYLGPSPEDEAMLLERYFGRPADDDRLQRLRLMRQVCRFYHGAVLMSSAAGWSPPPDARQLVGPSLAKIGAAIAADRTILARPPIRFAYGMAMLNQALAASQRLGSRRKGMRPALQRSSQTSAP